MNLIKGFYKDEPALALQLEGYVGKQGVTRLFKWFEKKYSESNRLEKLGYASPASSGVLLAEISNVIGLLESCKYKLKLYRAEHSGEYIGGAEYTALIQQINDMIEKLSKQSA